MVVPVWFAWDPLQRKWLGRQGTRSELFLIGTGFPATHVATRFLDAPMPEIPISCVATCVARAILISCLGLGSLTGPEIPISCVAWLFQC